ncbi:MAG: iron-containing alcohol dehydrogenase [Spirochaetaceae bacterium]|nr:iron-containing alcohol dehydrogenase [Spirochaetaceae bacterium]MDT8297994.1 iron-containing alcohol dehydrogenase [Spirochaetaceae bacterium]
MLNFEFVSPTRFIFGRDAEKALVDQAKTLGTKILLHYGGGSIKKSGLYDRVKTSLKEAGVDFTELGGVKPNPALSTVREGIELCRAEGVTGILAVGGGSVIDSGKGIAVGVPYEGDVWDFYTRKAVIEQALPIGVILTLPAAGSEGSDGSVVTDMDTQSKFDCGSDLIRPKFALLNPELSYTLPPYQTAVGAVDMISHVMERYFTNTEAVDVTDRLCESVIRSVIKAAPKALADPEDYEARAAIMWAGTIAHNNILGVGREHDWASHNIEHELSAQYDVAHGAGLAVVFPAWMTYVHETNIQRFVQFAVRVWDVDYTAGEEKAAALEAILRHKEFYRSLGMPTSLKELGITDDRYDIMAEKATRNGSLGGFRKLDKNDVIAIYKLAAKG